MFLHKIIAALSDWSGDWVHYTNINKLGVNPKQFHQDPAGIYLFPEEFKPAGTLWTDKKYKILVNTKPNMKVLDLAKLSNNEMQRIADRVGLDKNTFENPRDLWDALRNHYFLSVGAPGAGAWNKDFRDLGYNAIFDDTGTIHTAETQLVALDPRILKIKEVVPQKKGSGIEDIKKYQKLVEKYSAPYGEVTISTPRTVKQSGYFGKAPKKLIGEVKVEDGDKYIIWRVSRDNDRFMRLDFYDASKRFHGNYSLGGLVEKEEEVKRTVERASDFVFKEEEE